MDSIFENERKVLIEKIVQDKKFQNLSREWFQCSVDLKYSYNFNWLGTPVIQYPSDLVSFQEIVFRTRPKCIIECGVARAGSLLFWASIQEICGLVPRVIGIDIDIRDHARAAIMNSRYFNQINLIQCNSIDKTLELKLSDLLDKNDKVMVVLDSNHTKSHVLQELRNYSKFVSRGCYLLVLDTSVEFTNPEPTKNWSPGNSPWNAVEEFLEENRSFERDNFFENRNSVTVARGGFLVKK